MSCFVILSNYQTEIRFVDPVPECVNYKFALTIKVVPCHPKYFFDELID